MSVYTQEISKLGRLGDSHQKVIELVPPGSVVLDVGCASGYLARELVARGAAAVDGLEYDRVEAEEARAACRRVVVGSVEDPDSHRPAARRCLRRNRLRRRRRAPRPPGDGTPGPVAQTEVGRPLCHLGAQYRSLLGAPRAASRTVPVRRRRPPRPHAPPLLHTRDARGLHRRCRPWPRPRGLHFPTRAGGRRARGRAARRQAAGTGLRRSHPPLQRATRVPVRDLGITPTHDRR